MKIAMITDLPRLYEKTMYLHELQTEARRQNITVEVFVLEAGSTKLDARFPVHRFLKGALFAAKARQYDVIHVQFTLPYGLTSNLTKGFHRKPVLIHTHGYDVFVLPAYGIGMRRIGLADFLARATWKAADGIIAVCAKARRQIIREGIQAEKVYTLYNAVNETLFTKKSHIEDPKIRAIKEDSEVVFLNIGNLVPVKNHTNLLVAFKKYLKSGKSPPSSKLVICGDGPLRRRLDTFAKNIGVSSRVSFIGQVPHEKMPELYSAADVFVLPSLSEAHPWSLLEAMSCELAVTASRVGGIPETIPTEGLLVDPSKPQEMAEKMRHLAENPDLRKHLGSENRKTILKKFTFKSHLAELAKIYERLLE